MQGLESLSVVDQREIQRRGGVCARFPVSCLIYDMLVDMGMQPKDLVIFDTTFGEGRFYGAFRREIGLLIGADIRILNWVVEPDVFIRKPVWASWRIVEKLGVRPTLVVVDPPWGRIPGGRHSRKHYYLGFGSPSIILEEGIRAAEKLGCSHILIHYHEVAEPRNWKPIAITRFIYYSRYLKQDTSTAPKTTYFYILERC